MYHQSNSTAIGYYPEIFLTILLYHTSPFYYLLKDLKFSDNYYGLYKKGLSWIERYN